eukprot:PhF_6_TR18538/c0_g1_i2/m.27074
MGCGGSKKESTTTTNGGREGAQQQFTTSVGPQQGSAGDDTRGGRTNTSSSRKPPPPPPIVLPNSSNSSPSTSATTKDKKTVENGSGQNSSIVTTKQTQQHSVAAAGAGAPSESKGGAPAPVVSKGPESGTASGADAKASKLAAVRAEEIRTGTFSGKGALWRKHKSDPNYYDMDELCVIEKQIMYEQCSEDVEFLKDINAEYGRSLQNHIDVLTKALTEKNLQAMFSEAHSLKGASANLGIQRIAAVSLEIEMLARNPEAPHGSPLGAPIPDAVFEDLEYYLNVLRVVVAEYKQTFGTLTWP